MEVNGKLAVVVGGASGMARATAEMLASRGARVAVLDLATSDGAAVAREIGRGAIFQPIDVTDDLGAEESLAAAVAALGGVHIAVNTVGGSRSRRIISRTEPLPLDEFRRTIEFNLVATFNLNRLQAWYMRENEPEDGERGVIVNTASIAAFEGMVGQVAYSAAKAGIAGMSLTMARDLGSLGIRVNAIAPSLFDTGLTAGISEEGEARLTKDAAFPKRMGRPVEYAKLVLAIVDNPMLNGGTIRLDGGQRFAPK